MMRQFFLSVLILPMIVTAQGPMDSSFVINGELKGLPENSAVFLTNGNNAKDTLAKAYVKNGSFVLSGHIPEPNIYELNCPFFALPFSSRATPASGSNLSKFEPIGTMTF